MRVGADAHRGGGRRTECGPMRPGRGRLGCAQNDGGVVWMINGDVTIRGGTISNTKAVRARRSRSCDVCALCARALSGIAAAHVARGCGVGLGGTSYANCRVAACRNVVWRDVAES